MNCNTAPKDNVIFLHLPLDSEKQNADGSTGPAIFCEVARSTPKEISECVENAKQGSEYDRKDKVRGDLEAVFRGTLTRTQLMSLYSGAYSSWSNMKTRCKKGAGVLHPQFEDFCDFLVVMGPRPKIGYSIDRIDHNLPDYSPDNCRWLSKGGQTANRRNTLRLEDSLGNFNTIKEWSSIWGVPANTIYRRYKLGWSVDHAVQTAVGVRRASLIKDPILTYNGYYIPLWRQLIRDAHGQTFFVPSGKDAKQLQLIADAFSDGEVWPDEALKYILTHWREFTRYAESEYGAWQKPPSVPTIAYLYANIQAAGNFYLASKKTVAPVSYTPKPMFELPKLVEPDTTQPTKADRDALLAELEKYDV